MRATSVMFVIIYIAASDLSLIEILSLLVAIAYRMAFEPWFYVVLHPPASLLQSFVPSFTAYSNLLTALK